MDKKYLRRCKCFLCGSLAYCGKELTLAPFQKTNMTMKNFIVKNEQVSIPYLHLSKPIEHQKQWVLFSELIRCIILKFDPILRYLE